MKKLKNNDEMSSLSHTKWNCQYHIVFTPKYRRKAIYNKLRKDIGRYLRRLCDYQGVEIIEANACSDHIHMLVKIPPKLSVSKFMGYLKGKSSLMIFEEHANLKYNYGNRHFWAEGYFVSTVGANKNTIKKYIRDDGIVKVSRSVKELGIKVKQLQNEYLKKNKEEISIQEIAKELNVDKEEVIFAIEAQRPVESIYQEEQGDEKNKRELISKIPSNNNQENNIVNNMALAQIIENLDSRERQIIILRFYRDKTQTQVGKMLGISQVQVSRIEKNVLSKIKQKLEAS